MGSTLPYENKRKRAVVSKREWNECVCVCVCERERERERRDANFFAAHHLSNEKSY